MSLRTLDIVCLVIAAAALLTAGGLIIWQRRKTRRLLERLDAMLDSAMDGEFCESDYDESVLSAVETRMSRYLAGCTVSARNLAAEKDKIKELISDISHQTKTPVANILLYAQLLGEKNLPPDCADCVHALAAQAEKLNFLITALVKTSRLESGIVSVCPAANPVSGLLDAVLAQAAPRAAKKRLILTAGPTDAQAMFDPKWTAEALYNLVDNAVKYTPAGGSIRITVQPYELFCRIDVADTGIGIPEEEQAKIFARFYRGDAVRREPGVGIGLFLARQIVAAEGGYIKVESAPGKGAVFSLFLPEHL